MTTMRVTKNITAQELECRCGAPECSYRVLPDAPVIALWQAACDHFANELGVARVVLVVHSAARCTEYNRRPVTAGGPGSTDDSQHPRACAIDAHIEGVTPRAVYDYFDRHYPSALGLGLYSTFVHVDTRPNPARWGV